MKVRLGVRVRVADSVSSCDYTIAVEPYEDYGDGGWHSVSLEEVCRFGRHLTLTLLGAESNAGSFAEEVTGLNAARVLIAALASITESEQSYLDGPEVDAVAASQAVLAYWKESRK